MTNEPLNKDDADVLGLLLGPTGPDLTCEECFEHFDRYVELELIGAEAEAEASVPDMRVHLAGCPACGEDHESLLALVAGEPPQASARGD